MVADEDDCIKSTRRTIILIIRSGIDITLNCRVFSFKRSFGVLRGVMLLDIMVSSIVFPQQLSLYLLPVIILSALGVSLILV